MTFPKPLRERQAEQVRSAVLEATAGQLEEKAVDDVSMSDVAAAAGVSLRTLYRYFPDRASLLAAAGEHVYGSLGVPFDITDPEGISASFLDAARRMSTRPALTRALVQTTAGRTARSAGRPQRVAAIRTALKPLTDGLDEDTARRATAVIAHLCSAVSWVSITDDSGLDDTDAQQAVAWAIDTLVTALRHDNRSEPRHPGRAIRPSNTTRGGHTMTVTSAPAQIGNQQIATELATSRAWWFLGTLLVLRNPEGAPPCPAVMELTIPPGGSPPEHVHEALDDSFYLLDGELVARCGDQTLVARPGSYVVLPHGVGHTFRVTSRVPARLLLVHADDSFLRFVQTIGTPASEYRLPPPGEADLDFDALSRASAEHGAPMVGPSLDEDEARRHLPPESEPTLGAISHIALSVTDLAESERWYRENFDLVRIDGAIAGDGSGHITLLSSTGGWILALSSASTAEIQHVAVGCEDRDALMRWREMLTDRGAAPGTITDAPYGSGFVVRDPDGSELELFAAAPAP